MLINLSSSPNSVKDSEREYGLDDKVGVGLKDESMTVRNWTEEWWKWLLGIEEKDSPFAPTSPHLNTNERIRAGQPTPIQRNSMNKTNQSVWFLIGPPYGIEGETLRVKVPPNWSILASPYNAFASPEFYPSCDTIQKCNQLLNEDLEGVYEVYATLDGIRLIGCTVKQEDPFQAPLPVKNIFDGIPGTHNLVQHGHWVFLKPPPEGDHWLHLHGYSKNYQLDIKFHLMVHA